MTAPYAECDIDALIAIRDQLPPRDTAAATTARTGLGRGDLIPWDSRHINAAQTPPANHTRGDS